MSHAHLMIASAGLLSGAAAALILLFFFHLLGYKPAWYYWVVIAILGAAFGCFSAIGASELNVEKIEMKQRAVRSVVGPLKSSRRAE